MEAGTIIRVIRREGDWCQVRVNSKDGYRMAEFVKLMGVEEEAAYIATLDDPETRPSRRLPRRRPRNRPEEPTRLRRPRRRRRRPRNRPKNPRRPPDGHGRSDRHACAGAAQPVRAHSQRRHEAARQLRAIRRICKTS